MTQPVFPAGLSVADLTRRLLHEQAEAHSQGLALADDAGDATPHDPTPAQPIDPQLAWADALAALPAARSAVPPEWPALANGQEPAVSLAFALGNYPQQVRHIAALLVADPANLREKSAPGQPRPELVAWADAQKGDHPRLLAAGVLRLARLFDDAGRLLAAPVAEPFAAVQANERAALLWHRGEREAALAAWLAQPDSVPVLFNRGMALLFTGDSTSAAASLARAQEGLPETSAWHHLAGLYVAMASVLA